MIFDFANVATNHGVAQSLTGIVIVFFALSVIALMIAMMPFAMSILSKYVPEQVPVVKRRAKKKSSDEDVAVVIALSHHTQQNGK
jgi:Na+-transporting methylmalonyl-CoA/oxaloacetate decarboxylase gamma subunit